MASITEISVEHIHNAYESIRGNIAVEAFYAVVTGFMAVTLIHRLYTVYREVQSNEDGTPTMKDYMNLVWQYVFCIAAVALFPVLLEALETVFGKLMDDLQAGFGGKVYDVADLFQKPIIAQFEKQFSDMSVMDVAGVLLNPVGSSFDYLLAYVAGVIAAPFYMYAQTLFIVGRYMFLLLLELISPVAIACFYNESTRTYFHTWCKNLLVCYLMVPAFILASKFSDAIVCEYVMNTSWNVVLQVLFSLALKLSLLAIVRGRIHNLFKTTEEYENGYKEYGEGLRLTGRGQEAVLRLCQGGQPVVCGHRRPGAVLHEHDRPRVTDRILVVNTGGEFLQLKSMETDKLYETLLKAHCNAVAYYVNSFDRMSISGNQAQAVFLVEKSELNAIWNKYLNNRAYADAADRGVIYKCVFEKLHRVGIRDDGYNVLFTSILSIHDAGGVKRIRIYSRGDAIRTTPSYPENVTGFFLELYTGIRAVG